MKKLILFSTILLFSLSFFYLIPLSHSATSYYAKVEEEGVFLYSNPQIGQNNQLFELPKTYFVRLYEDASDDFYYCAYKDIYGYVKKSEVSVMSGTPTNPYVEAQFRVYSINGLGLYSSPKLDENLKIIDIPFLTDNLVYYGLLTGQEAVPEKSNKWIYCKYSASNNVYGYVYSVFCDNLTSFSPNNETFDIVETPFPSKQSISELTPIAMGFIIVGVSLPCLIVLYLLVRPSMQREKIETTKPKMKAKRHKDYFEFDDGDLT